MNKIINNLESLLAKQPNNALLHYSLGLEYLNQRHARQAIEHLSTAVKLAPDHSASWKTYGKALTANGEARRAVEIYKKGIAVATEKGDRQAAREMRVFLTRVQKKLQ